jgi:hypothetical protein
MDMLRTEIVSKAEMTLAGQRRYKIGHQTVGWSTVKGATQTCGCIYAG